MSLRGLVGACAVLIAALAATGCGSGGLTGAGDAARGKELFVNEGQCGSCHVLADAGTKGVIGPNLDDAFLQARHDGLGEATIRAVVRDQISYPVEEPSTGSPGMPADLVTGEDADAVAAYVASVAGLPVTGGSEAGGGTDRRVAPRRRRAAARLPTVRRSSPRPGAAAATSSRPRARAAPSARTSTSHSRRRSS